MNKHLLRIAGIAIVILNLQMTGFAQQLVPTPGEVIDDADTVPAARRGGDEIIIRHKNDKDTKVVIEIKNGEVFVNGKPASDYEDDNLTVTKRKSRTTKKGNIYFNDDGDMDMAPFIQQFKGSGMPKRISSRPMLGVTSDRPANGPAGAKIAEISPGSGADKGGLKQGDLIIKVDELPVDGPESLSEAIGRYKPGEKVIITITRDGKEQKVNVTLGTKEMNRELYNFRTPDGQDFNFDFKQLMPPGAWGSDGNSAKLGIRAQDTEDGKGVKVLYVDGESTAAKAGIKEGDIITRFDGKEINSAPVLAQAAREAKEKRSVHVNLWRDGKALEVDVQNPHKLKTADL
jgi:serine protease Do